jgi:hypothetical protein
MSTVIELSNNQQQGNHSSEFTLSNAPSSFAYASDSNQQQVGAGNSNVSNNSNSSSSSSNGVILARLKEIENSNQNMMSTIEGLQNEIKAKNDSIQKLHNTNKELSADKRKDMEQIVETAIDDWLNSLTGISSDVRKQFRDGVTRLAEQADMKNNAWEVVCNASKAHKDNVNIIEQLRRDCTERDKTIETLLSSNSDPTFGSDSSRIDAGSSNKRQRNGGGGGDVAVSRNEAPGEGGDAWDNFAKMLSDNGKSLYY